MSPIKRCRTTSSAVNSWKEMSSISCKISRIIASPDLAPLGKSIWVTSPVITILEPKPSRVRNIFICSGVVFCASSRIIKASLSVRPRINARGATSITPDCISRGIESISIMSCSASKSGRKYGSIFSESEPGKKPRCSPASTAGRVRTMRLTFFACSAATAFAIAK